MKITLEPYSGGTFTAQDDAEHISKVVNMFKGLLVQVGYHPQTVDSMFTEDIETWFPESDKEHTTKSFSEKKKKVDAYLNNLYHESFD